MARNNKTTIASALEGSTPIVPTPRPKFELFVELLTFAVTVFTAYKVLQLEQSVKELEEGNYAAGKQRDFAPRTETYE